MTNYFSSTSNDISIYPNPSEGRFTIVGKKVPRSIDAYDFTGKLIKSFEPNGIQNTIDLSEVGTGVYLILVVSEKGSQVLKVVIKYA